MAEDILEPALSPESILNPVGPYRLIRVLIQYIGAYVARVLEIIPDVQPAHLHTLVMQYIETHKGDTVELILHALFENSGYAKIGKYIRRCVRCG